MVGNQMTSLRLAPLLIVVVLLALAGIGATLYALRRRAARSGKGTLPGLRADRDVTVVFRAEHRGGGRPAASYVLSVPDSDGTYLIPLQGDAETPGEPIPIQARSLYIGRDGNRAQIVFTDPSVSRLHARLVEEVDGVFVLHDEGSASGTFVNDERVDLQPRELHSGDLLEFGRQRVLFQTAELFGDLASFPSQG
jgi:hypothetical protein